MKHYFLALEIANNDIDKAIRLYTLGHFEKDPDKLKGKDDYVEEVLGAMNGNIKCDKCKRGRRVQNICAGNATSKRGTSAELKGMKQEKL